MGFKVGGIDVSQVAASLQTGGVLGAALEVAKQEAEGSPDSIQINSGPLQQTPANMKAGVSGRNDTLGNRKSGSGPISAAEWADPSKLLAKLTQNPAKGPTALSHSTCAASNLLGAALMASPEHAARLCGNVAQSANSAQLSLPEKAELGQIGQRIFNHSATFEDLNRAQELLYKAGNTVTDPDALVEQALTGNGLSPDEKTELKNLSTGDWNDTTVKRMGELVTKGTGTQTTFTRAGQGWDANVQDNRSDTDTSGYTDKEEANLAKLGGVYTDPSVTPGLDYSLQDDVKSLAPGQSMTSRIVGQASQANDLSATADHFVTIGRRTDGTWYMYNPDPGNGDAALVVGGKGSPPSADFMKQVGRYSGRIPQDNDGKMPTPLKYRQE